MRRSRRLPQHLQLTAWTRREEKRKPETRKSKLEKRNCIMVTRDWKLGDSKREPGQPNFELRASIFESRFPKDVSFINQSLTYSIYNNTRLDSFNGNPRRCGNWLASPSYKAQRVKVGTNPLTRPHGRQGRTWGPVPLPPRGRGAGGEGVLSVADPGDLLGRKSNLTWYYEPVAEKVKNIVMLSEAKNPRIFRIKHFRDSSSLSLLRMTGVWHFSSSF